MQDGFSDGTSRDTRLRPGGAPRIGWGLAAALAIAFLGCGDRVSRVPVLDLIEAFESANAIRPIETLDFGTEAATPHLGHGWSIHETREDGVTFTWALGGRSELEFFLTRRQELDLRARLWSFDTPGTPPQTIETHVNGRPTEPISVAPGVRGTYRIRVPRTETVPGMNRLTFLYGRSTVPAEVGEGPDMRPLAVAWDRLRFSNSPTTGGEGPEVGDDGLRIPFGTEVAYTLPMPDGMTLDFTALRIDGPGQLVVFVDSDHVGPMSEIEVLDSDRPSSVDLGESVVGIPVRVGLRAEANGVIDPDHGWQGVVLTNPKLMGRPPTAATHRPITGVAPAPPRGGRPLRQGPPDILLYVVGSLRVDRLGCYGYGGGVTPNIDRVARQGAVFSRARAGTSSTKPAVTSILTGLPSLQHGVHAADDAVPRGLTTVAERLNAAGWTTGAFVSSTDLSAAAGFDRGFDRFDRRDADAAATVERALSWLDGTGDGPVFTFVYVDDAEGPYDPPDSLRDRFAPNVEDPALGRAETLERLRRGEAAATAAERAGLEALYSAEVASIDQAFGAYIEGLEERRRYRDTAVIVVSDHGTAFFERGVLGHGRDLFGEVLRIPLTIRLRASAGAGARSQLAAEHTDLLPTLLSIAELPADPALPGWDLLPWIGVRRGVPRRTSIAYLELEGRRGVSIFDGQWTMMVPLSPSFAAAPALFDSTTDPLEATNRIFNRPVRAALLQRMARQAARNRGPDAPKVSSDNDLRDRLHALGLRASGAPP